MTDRQTSRPFAAAAAALTPDRLAALRRLATRATARYRRAGVDSADVLADLLSLAAEAGEADLLSVIAPEAEADTLRRLENLARSAARSNARRLARECGAVAAGNLGSAALAAIGEAVAASPRPGGAMHRATGDSVRDSARLAALAADGTVQRSAAAPLPGVRGGDVSARYAHSAAAFDASERGGTLAARNSALRAADRTFARLSERTHREGGATLISESSLDRLMAEAMRTGGGAVGFAETAGRTLPGEAISLALLSERSTAETFAETFAATVDSLAAVRSGRGAAAVADAVAAYSASRSLRAERATALRAEAVRTAAHSAALAETFAREVKTARSVSRADLAAAGKVAASAAAAADLARDFAAAPASLSRLIMSAVSVTPGTEKVQRSPRPGMLPALDLAAVAACLALPFATVAASGREGSSAAALRLRAIVAAARSAAVAAAEADATGRRSPRAVAVDSARAKVAARSARRPAAAAAVSARPGAYLRGAGGEAETVARPEYGPAAFAPEVFCTHVDLRTGEAVRCECHTPARSAALAAHN